MKCGPNGKNGLTALSLAETEQGLEIAPVMEESRGKWDVWDPPFKTKHAIYKIVRPGQHGAPGHPVTLHVVKGNESEFVPVGTELTESIAKENQSKPRCAHSRYANSTIFVA